MELRGRLPPTEKLFYHERKIIERLSPTKKILFKLKSQQIKNVFIIGYLLHKYITENLFLYIF